MSGTVAIKGFLLQGMYALTRILEADEWFRLRLESTTRREANGREVPDKVDFEIDNRAIQVKHSKNIIETAQIKKWCQEFEQYAPLKETRELVVLGKFRGQMRTGDIYNNVSVTLESSDNLQVWRSHLAVSMQKYVERVYNLGVPAFMVRGILSALTYEILFDSALAKSMTHAEFESKLRMYLAENYPELLDDKAVELEELRYRLGNAAMIDQANYEARRNACVEALDLLTRKLLVVLNPNPNQERAKEEVEKFKALEPQSAEIIRVHNTLIATVENEELIAVFVALFLMKTKERPDKSIYMDTNVDGIYADILKRLQRELKTSEIAPTDLLNEFRNLVRFELKVSNHRLTLDRSIAIIA